MKKLTKKKVAVIRSTLDGCDFVIGDLLGYANALEAAGVTGVEEELRDIIGCVDQFRSKWHEILSTLSA